MKSIVTVIALAVAATTASQVSAQNARDYRGPVAEQPADAVTSTPSRSGRSVGRDSANDKVDIGSSEATPRICTNCDE